MLEFNELNIINKTVQLHLYYVIYKGIFNLIFELSNINSSLNINLNSTKK